MRGAVRPRGARILLAALALAAAGCRPGAGGGGAEAVRAPGAATSGAGDGGVDAAREPGVGAGVEPAPTIGRRSSGRPTAAGRAPRASGSEAPGEAPFGVQVFEDDTTTDAILRIRAAGATWARTRALWKLVEPEPGRYDWTVTDALFGDATAAGLRNLAAVYANPAWAGPTECGPPGPDGRARWTALWTALAERYDGDGQGDAPSGGVVRWWQVGNEVDFDAASAGAEGDYGSCFGDRPEAYAELLAEARAAVRAADPGARVGFGPVAWDRFTAATAPAGWTAPPGPYAYDFTERALEAMARSVGSDAVAADGLVDFVALHHYNDNAHAWDGPAGLELVARVARYREAQLHLPGAYDVRGLPLVVSEIGLAAAPSDAYTERSEALQAAYAAQAAVRAAAAGVAIAVWYTARDNLMGDCAPPHWDWLAFGLMRSDDRRDALRARCPGTGWDGAAWAGAYALDEGPATPRPALGALATALGMLRGRSFERGLGAAAGTGSGGESAVPPAVEAYRFRGADGAAMVAAWATAGARLGARTLPPPRADWRLDAALLDGWTGRVAVTDHLGGRAVTGEAGRASVTLSLGDGPVYVEVAPADG